jgi:hypothetical protein
MLCAQFALCRYQVVISKGVEGANYIRRKLDEEYEIWT